MFKSWMKLYLGMVVLLPILLPAPVEALEVAGLYQAKVPVKGQTRTERLDVYPQALAQVIVKLSGDSRVPELPQLSAFMAQAVSLVQQFSYAELPADQLLIEEGYTRLLLVRFDGDTISQALIEAEVPLWGHTRSEVLLVLAIEDRETRYLVAANALAELEANLTEYASRRGLPVILPLMDIEDQINLKFASVWGDFRHDLMRASQRYGTDAVLVGRLIRTRDGMWQTRWSLHQNADTGSPTEYWYTETNTQQEALAAGINGTADRISKRYAQLYSVASADSVLLTVTGVNDLAGYARTIKYLEAQDIVTAVEVNKVIADRVLFKLALRGDMIGLERAVSLGTTLRPVQDAIELPRDDMSLGRALVYQLLP